MDDFTFPLSAYLGDPVAAPLPAPGSAAPEKSLAGRIKRIYELLEHPACAGDRAEVKHQLCNRPRPGDLRRITSLLGRKIKEAGKHAR